MSDDNLKAPSQIFKWFEKMKENYDKNVLAIMQRFEQNNNLQQNRIDESHKSHINIMRESHLAQISQYNSQLEQQQQEIDYFKQQIAQQQQTISQLNNRYDAVIVEFISNKQATIPFKDIFDDSAFIGADESETTHATHSSSLSSHESFNQISSGESNNEQNIEELYRMALEMRNDNNIQQAFTVFEKAAKLGHTLAMGALGRAYFLAEGVEENHVFGLAWLINAAELNLPQAIKRVEYFKMNDPKLYQEALTIPKEFTNERLTSVDNVFV